MTDGFRFDTGQAGVYAQPILRAGFDAAQNPMPERRVARSGGIGKRNPPPSAVAIVERADYAFGRSPKG